MTIPVRQIRAVYDADTIRVYQAYNDAIADSALAHGTFISPPYKKTRMTWIKPSFLWMMYRSGWAQKDDNQRRILAIDIRRSGFAWALSHSAPSSVPPGMDVEAWQAEKARAQRIRVCALVQRCGVPPSVRLYKTCQFSAYALCRMDALCVHGLV